MPWYGTVILTLGAALIAGVPPLLVKRSEHRNARQTRTWELRHQAVVDLIDAATKLHDAPRHTMLERLNRAGALDPPEDEVDRAIRELTTAAQRAKVNVVLLCPNLGATASKLLDSAVVPDRWAAAIAAFEDQARKDLELA